MLVSTSKALSSSKAIQTVFLLVCTTKQKTSFVFYVSFLKFVVVDRSTISSDVLPPSPLEPSFLSSASPALWWNAFLTALCKQPQCVAQTFLNSRGKVISEAQVGTLKTHKYVNIVNIILVNITIM